MARVARIKSHTNPYHIVVRSIKEIDLFKEPADKEKYLVLMRKYITKYGFAVYAYCLMDNHGHFIIDCLGSDISTVMHCVNFSYAQYYNRKYKRYGPVFQDRFKSTIVDTDRYMITLSAYIHNNPKDIPGYEDNVHLYPFSSLKEFLNGTNTFGVLTRSFLASLINFKYKENKKAYLNLVRMSNKEDVEVDIEFMNEKTEYHSHKQLIVRDFTPNEIIKYVATYFNQGTHHIYIKYRRDYIKIRAVTCLLMSAFCDMTQQEICEIIGNITQSGVSYLISKGISIVSKENEIITGFIA